MKRMTPERLNFLIDKAIPSVGSRKHKGWLVELTEAIRTERAIVSAISDSLGEWQERYHPAYQIGKAIRKIVDELKSILQDKQDE